MQVIVVFAESVDVPGQAVRESVASMIVGGHAVPVPDQMVCKRGVTSAVFAETMHDDDFCARVFHFVAPNVEPQAIGSGNRLFDESHKGPPMATGLKVKLGNNRGDLLVEEPRGSVRGLQAGGPLSDKLDIRQAGSLSDSSCKMLAWPKRRGTIKADPPENEFRDERRDTRGEGGNTGGELLWRT